MTKKESEVRGAKKGGGNGDGLTQEEMKGVLAGQRRDELGKNVKSSIDSDDVITATAKSQATPNDFPRRESLRWSEDRMKAELPECGRHHPVPGGQCAHQAAPLHRGTPSWRHVSRAAVGPTGQFGPAALEPGPVATLSRPLE